MVWKHIAALAALILISYPAAAFNDGPTQQTQGITFFVAIPLDARDVKEQSLYSGLAIQGKRAHENVRIDSRMFNDTRTVNFFGTGIEVKWIIAGVVAAGAVAAVATKEKATTTPTSSSSSSTAHTTAAAAAAQQQQNGRRYGHCPVRRCP